MVLTSKFGTEDVSPYQIHSRREILSLMRAMQERNQLVSLQIDGGAEAIITSVLEVKEDEGIVVIDRAPGNIVNQRILESDNVSFETLLDNIRIIFFSPEVRECVFEGLPALSIPLPAVLIRLQRREHYRVLTPVANPLRCTVRAPEDQASGAVAMTVVVTVKDISGGGIGVIDEKKLLDDTIGKIYKGCRIDLPGNTALVVDLQIRNSHEISLTTGKSIRKLGCMFVNPPSAMEAAVQRYITKLERERNAKATGMN